MATVAARLHAITGLTGVSFATYLRAMAAGSTIAQVLPAYSGLSGVTMGAHLLVDSIPPDEEAQPTGGGATWFPDLPHRKRRRRRAVALLLTGVV